LQGFDFLLGNRDAREMRDAADGGGIDSHGGSPPAGRDGPAYSRAAFTAAT
jgi:hypothetical protein